MTDTEIKNEKNTILQLYAALILSLILSFVPEALIQIFSLVLLLWLLLVPVRMRYLTTYTHRRHF